MNSGGSRKTTSSAFANINAVSKQIFPYLSETEYVWNKYSISTKQIYEQAYNTVSKVTLSYRGKYFCGNSITFNKTNGTFTINSPGQSGEFTTNASLPYDYVNVDGSSSSGLSKVYYAVSGTFKTSSSASNFYMTVSYGEMRIYYAKSTTQQTQGSYLGQVTSTSSSTYPSNGISGSYWYVYQGES